MRLTLRTLLAYRDGVLSPADSEDLHRRIQQSEDAGNLLRRIDAVTKQIQRASPTIVGRGLGGDPNSFAEYLDDVLLNARVLELERICLESDIHLSELATCHSLLAKALHTRVVVPDSLRQLAVDIGSPDRREGIREQLKLRKQRRNGAGQIVRADAAHVPDSQDDVADAQASLPATSSPATSSPATSSPATDSEPTVQVTAPMVASGGESIKEQGLNLEGSALAHEVPEYLVGKNQGNWRFPLAIGALIALLGMLVWQALGPLDRVKELFATVPNGPEQPNTLPATGDSASAEDSADDSAEPGAEGSAIPSAESAGGDAKDRSADEATSEVTDGETGGKGESTSPPTTDDEIRESSEAPPGAADAGPSNAAADSATAQTPPLPDDELEQGVWVPKDEQETAAVILARSDSGWRRLVPGDSLTGHEQLIVPPNYRTTLDLPGGVLWTTGGASRFHIAGGTAPELTSDLCRSLLRSGPSGNQLTMVTPVGKVSVEMGSLNSMAGIEISYRPKQLGSVLEDGVYQPTLIVVAVEGQVTVRQISADQADNAFPLGLGEGLAIIGDGKPKTFKLKSIPSWYPARYDRPIDGLAAEDLVRLLQVNPDQNSPNTEELLASLTKYPKPETAALAIQTSLLAGDWSHLVGGFLDNSNMSAHWNKTLDLAVQILAAAPDTANVLRAGLSARGPKGDLQFQMLTGLTSEQVNQDGLGELISQLGDNDLASRVLAIYQLNKLTGKVLAYLPYAPNRASIQQWRRELATERLKLLKPSDLIYERNPTGRDGA